MSITVSEVQAALSARAAQILGDKPYGSNEYIVAYQQAQREAAAGPDPVAKLRVAASKVAADPIPEPSDDLVRSTTFVMLAADKEISLEKRDDGKHVAVGLDQISHPTYAKAERAARTALYNAAVVKREKATKATLAAVDAAEYEERKALLDATQERFSVGSRVADPEGVSLHVTAERLLEIRGQATRSISGKLVYESKDYVAALQEAGAMTSTKAS